MISAQARAQSIPASWKTLADVEPHRQEIANAVHNKIVKLTGDDLAAATEARKWFATQVTSKPSASFMDVYADVINSSLVNIMRPKDPAQAAPIHVRLNAAIINYEVSQAANNARQVPATDLFLHDPSAAVVLWGMKAAKFELYAQLSQPNIMRKPDLLRSIIDAVKAHPDNGAIAAEAYSALTLEATDKDLHNTSDPTIQELVPVITEMLNYRVSMFGDAGPPNLFAEDPAITFVTRTKVRAVETPDQRKKVIDVLFTYVAGICKLLANPAVDNKNELLDTLHRIARAFSVIADANPALVKAADAINAIAPDTKPEDIDKRVVNLKTAIDTAPTH